MTHRKSCHRSAGLQRGPLIKQPNSCKKSCKKSCRARKSAGGAAVFFLPPPPPAHRITTEKLFTSSTQQWLPLQLPLPHPHPAPATASSTNKLPSHLYCCGQQHPLLQVNRAALAIFGALMAIPLFSVASHCNLAVLPTQHSTHESNGRKRGKRQV